LQDLVRTPPPPDSTRRRRSHHALPPARPASRTARGQLPQDCSRGAVVVRCAGFAGIPAASTTLRVEAAPASSHRLRSPAFPPCRRSSIGSVGRVGPCAPRRAASPLRGEIQSATYADSPTGSVCICRALYSPMFAPCRRRRTPRRSAACALRAASACGDVVGLRDIPHHSVFHTHRTHPTEKGRQQLDR